MGFTPDDLNYEGQEIDIAGCDSMKIFNQISKEWELLKIDLKKSVHKEIFGIPVEVSSKEKLISYKAKLARPVDIEDINKLK